MTTRDHAIRIATDAVWTRGHPDRKPVDQASDEAARICREIAEAVVDALIAAGYIPDRQPHGPRSSDEPA